MYCLTIVIIVIMTTKFWVEDPCILLSCEIFPSSEMTKEEKLNALSRMAILVCLILWAIGNKHWLLILLLSLLIIILLEYGTASPSASKIEGFSVPNTYLGTDFNQTIVSPVFSEEWRLPPYTYHTQTEAPQYVTFQEPPRPQSYPYGQYLTRTNLLPSDEYATQIGCGSKRTAREYANSAYLRHDIAHRENMMRIMKKKLQRRFKHNTGDTVSPFYSY